MSKSKNLRNFIKECKNYMNLSKNRSNIYAVNFKNTSRFGHQYLKHYTRKRYRYHLSKTYKLNIN